MIEQGLVLLIQNGISDLQPSVPGGFAVILPKDQISASSPMAWTYRSITSEPSYTLNGQDAFTAWNVQIDCHGYTMNYAMKLASAIDGVLRGLYQGTLPDEDETFVQGIFREPQLVDGYSDTNRSYVRTLEYLVQYDQQ